MADIRTIIEKLHSLGYLEPIRQTGNYMTCRCPFHGGGHEKKPSFGILLVDEAKGGKLTKAGWSHCFACSFAGNLEKTVSEILKLHAVNADAVEWLKQNIPGFDPSAGMTDEDMLVPPSLMGSVISKYAIDYINTLTQPKQEYVSEEELAKYRFTVPYMYERKLTDAIIEEYDVGFDLNWIPPGRKNPVPCLTFPVRDEQGRTLFFCRRSIQGKLYNYPEGVTKPVFGLDRLSSNCKSVVLCESIINALTARVYGYDSLALMGTGNSYQVTQLRRLGIREFILCFDGDEAGHKATEKWKRILRDVAIVWVIHMPDGKDLNNCTKDEFVELYQNRD